MNSRIINATYSPSIIIQVGGVHASPVNIENVISAIEPNKNPTSNPLTAVILFASLPVSQIIPRHNVKRKVLLLAVFATLIPG